jgi:hypothetical protein
MQSVTVAVGPGVRDYLAEIKVEKLAVRLLPKETAVCCNGIIGDGERSCVSYTPSLLFVKAGTKQDGAYEVFHQDGVELWVTPQALAAAKDGITVSLEKVLFIKKLKLSGIPAVVQGN